KEAKETYGLRSTETFKALIRVIGCCLDPFNVSNPPVDDHLLELLVICNDPGVELNAHQLRSVHLLIEKLDDRTHLSELLDDLEKILLFRRESVCGYDLETAGALHHLIEVWEARGKLQSAEKICRSVVERASQRLPEDDLALRHIKSAYSYLIK